MNRRVDVMADLARWGPESLSPPPSLAESERYCRDLARSHYENFPVVSWLLPRRLHQPFYNVYGFCRWADDLGDETGDSARSLELLAWWQRELDRCYAGEASHPVFIALIPTIKYFSLPKQLFADLISAFVQDQSVRRYDTFEQLLDYCRRSANPVGRIVLHLCERFTEQNGIWSDSVCTGLQLANFWQDVSRDHDIGRVYLPREDRERFGYRDDDLDRKRTTESFQKLMQFEVDRSREILLTGRPLMQQLSGRIRIEIDLFLRGGLLVLDGIERIDYRVWDQRPVISKSRLALAAIRSIVER